MKRIMKSFVSLLLIVAMFAIPMSASAASVARIMKVNGDWVRMRDKDGTQIARLRKGTKVLYWGVKDGAMYKVMTSSGKTGYVYGSYLTTYGAMKKNQVYVTTASTKMYKTSGNKLVGNGTLAKGKYVLVYKTSGDWAYIKTMTGKSAFVKKATLAKAF